MDGMELSSSPWAGGVMPSTGCLLSLSPCFRYVFLYYHYQHTYSGASEVLTFVYHVGLWKWMGFFIFEWTEAEEAQQASLAVLLAARCEINAVAGFSFAIRALRNSGCWHILLWDKCQSIRGISPFVAEGSGCRLHSWTIFPKGSTSQTLSNVIFPHQKVINISTCRAVPCTTSWRSVVFQGKLCEKITSMITEPACGFGRDVSLHAFFTWSLNLGFMGIQQHNSINRYAPGMWWDWTMHVPMSSNKQIQILYLTIISPLKYWAMWAGTRISISRKSWLL